MSASTHNVPFPLGTTHAVARAPRGLSPLLVFLLIAAPASVVAAFAPSAAEALAAVPWIIALILFGMPHGALDWPLLRRECSGRSVWLAVGAYSAIMCALAVMLVAVPIAMCIAFLLLAAWHFGVNDVRGSIEAGLARGGIVIGVPFAVHPEAAAAPFAAITAAVGSGWVLTESVLRLGGATLITVALTMLASRLFSAGRRGTFASEVAPTLAVGAAMAALPPLLGVGLYFLIVHSVGHCLRLARKDGKPHSISDTVRQLALLHRSGLPFLIPASVGAVVVGVFFLPGSWMWSLAVGFIAICIVATPPHHALWLWHDRSQAQEAAA
jgi:Brp/Blh family beta-carotene 15,15'-monooxygenase